MFRAIQIPRRCAGGRRRDPKSIQARSKVAIQARSKIAIQAEGAIQSRRRARGRLSGGIAPASPRTHAQPPPARTARDASVRRRSPGRRRRRKGAIVLRARERGRLSLGGSRAPPGHGRQPLPLPSPSAIPPLPARLGIADGGGEGWAGGREGRLTAVTGRSAGRRKKSCARSDPRGRSPTPCGAGRCCGRAAGCPAAASLGMRAGPIARRIGDRSLMAVGGWVGGWLRPCRWMPGCGLGVPDGGRQAVRAAIPQGDRRRPAAPAAAAARVVRGRRVARCGCAARAARVASAREE